MMATDGITNPFPGLRSFESNESDRFFGRDLQIQDILSKLKDNRFISVLGTSGSGKSSLVKGGVLPRLSKGKEEDWSIRLMRPENQPLQNLARQLAQMGKLDVPDEDAEEYIMALLMRSRMGLVQVVEEMKLGASDRVLMVVDQFEELFRYRKEERAQKSEDSLSAKFVNLLLEATGQRKVPIYVMLTMRSDFLSDCTDFHGLPEAINDGQYLIPRMTHTELRQVITGPMQQYGYPISNVLVNRLLYDLGSSMDQLPILQHALMRTWDYWRQYEANAEPMGILHYEAIGTMSQALSSHADEAFHELDEEHQRVCKRVFQALTQIGKEGRGIRRPTPLWQLCDIANAKPWEVVAVAEKFRMAGRAFMMPQTGAITQDTMLDISHESLMRVWQRLIDWVEEEYDHVEIYLQLTKAAQQYQENRAGLYRNPELEFALRWRRNQAATEAWGQRYHPGYLLAMEYLELSEREAQRGLQLQEKRRRQRLRLILSSAVLMCCALVVSLVLWLQASKNATEAAKAQQDAEDSQQEAVTALARIEEEKERALSATELAREAERRADSTRILAEQSAGEARLQRIRAIENQTVAEATKLQALALADTALQERNRAQDQQQRAEISERETNRLLTEAQIQVDINQADARATWAFSRVQDYPQQALDSALDAAEVFYQHQSLPLLQRNLLYQTLLIWWQRQHPRYRKSVLGYDVVEIQERANQLLITSANGVGLVRLSPGNADMGRYAPVQGVQGQVGGAHWVTSNQALVWTERGALYRVTPPAYGPLKAEPYPQPVAAPGSFRVMAAHATSLAAFTGQELSLYRYTPDSLQTLGTVPLAVRPETHHVLLQAESGGLRIYVLSRSGELSIWSLPVGTGQAKWEDGFRLDLKGHWPCILAVHPAGRSMALGLDHEISLLDLKSGTVELFSGHKGVITDLAFTQSSRGLQLASTSRDNTVRLWPLYRHSGTLSPYWIEEPLVIKTENHWINTVTFLNNDQLMLIGGTGGLLRWVPTQTRWLTDKLTLLK